MQMIILSHYSMSCNLQLETLVFLKELAAQGVWAYFTFYRETYLSRQLLILHLLIQIPYFTALTMVFDLIGVLNISRNYAYLKL